MAVRKVEIRVTSTGFDAIDKNLDELDAKLDRLSEKLDKISAKIVSPKIDIKGLDDSDRKLDDLDAKLDRMGGKTVTARVKVRIDRKELGHLGSDALRKLLGDAGGGVGGLLGDVGSAAESGGSGVGKDALSSLGGASNYLTGGAIATAIMLALSLSPAIIPFALGGGVGAGGLLAALGLTKGGKRDLSGLEKAGKNSLLGALTGEGEEAGPHGGEHSTGSFLSGLGPIFKQIDGFVKSTGPMLGQMFRASLPFISAFVKIFEQFGKAVMPAVLSIMKELTPYIPQIVQGFKILSDGIADFIKDLGPGIAASVTVFKGVATVVKGLLIGIAYVAVALATEFANVGHAIREDAIAIGHAFVKLRHDAAAAFDWIVKRVKQDVDHMTNSLDHWRHDIASITDAAMHYLESRINAGVHKVESEFDNLRHDASSKFDELRHDIASIWDEIWSNTIGRVERGVHDVENWFGNMKSGAEAKLRSLPGDLLRIGEDAMLGLLHGLEHIGPSVLSWVENFVNSIPSKFMKLLEMASPSKVMADIGTNIGLGLVKGMDGTHGLVQASATRLAKGIPASFNGAYIGASAGRALATGSNGQPALMITAQGDQLVKEIVKALRYEIKNNGGGNVQKYLGH